MYLVLKHTECELRPYFNDAQYIKLLFLKSYLNIFCDFIPFYANEPPIKYKSPFGVAIDL